MKPALEILEQVRIASPCPVRWESMAGDAQVRRCSQCDRQVFNLSSMAADEALNLIYRTRGDVCVQLWRRKDGTLITSNCPAGAKTGIQRAWRRVRALTASFVALLMLPGCFTRPGGGSAPNATGASEAVADEVIQLGGKVMPLEPSHAEINAPAAEPKDM